MSQTHYIYISPTDVSPYTNVQYLSPQSLANCHKAVSVYQQLVESGVQPKDIRFIALGSNGDRPKIGFIRQQLSRVKQEVVGESEAELILEFIEVKTHTGAISNEVKILYANEATSTTENAQLAKRLVDSDEGENKVLHIVAWELDELANSLDYNQIIKWGLSKAAKVKLENGFLYLRSLQKEMWSHANRVWWTFLTEFRNSGVKIEMHKANAGLGTELRNSQNTLTNELLWILLNTGGYLVFFKYLISKEFFGAGKVEKERVSEKARLR